VSVPSRPRIVLVGAGHAHLHLARHAAAFTGLGADLTLVTPGPFWYSGLATGVLAGMYDAGLDRVDPAPLLLPAAGRARLDRVTGLDRSARRLRLASGASLEYDLLSFNVGSEIAGVPIQEGLQRVFPVKPIENLVRLRRDLDRSLQRNGGRPTLRVVVVGGGATGCETAACIAALARRRGGEARVTLLTRGERLLAGHPQAAARGLAGCLRRRGVEILLSRPVVRVTQGVVLAGPGDRLPWDLLVLATGLRPPGWLQGLDLPLGPRGGLLVDATLRSAGDDRIYGAGDCIDLEGRDLPRLGVYGVRAAPILQRNLLARLRGGPAISYRPQRRALIVLNLGDGTGLALRGRLHWRGRLSLWLKDWIDRRFLARLRGGAPGAPIRTAP
jgi:NADH dehydrogenase FAD-containing subunit